MLPPTVEWAQSLPTTPAPEWVTEITDKLGVEVRLFDWMEFLGNQEAARDVAEGEASGSPYPTFFYGNTLYGSQRNTNQALAHEVGHIVAWAKAGRPQGYNYGLDPDAGTPLEEEACWVEAHLMESMQLGDTGDLIREHFNIGIIISYDPDDIQYNEEEDYEEGEGQYAWEEWEAAVFMGEKMLNEVLGSPVSG